MAVLLIEKTPERVFWIWFPLISEGLGGRRQGSEGFSREIISKEERNESVPLLAFLFYLFYDIIYHSFQCLFCL